MNAVIVSAHNPVTGPRHLGHYVCSMVDWPALARTHELVIVVDDLLGAIVCPHARGQLQSRTLQTVRECMALDIDFTRHHIVLTSMLPELHELASFAAMVVERAWVERLYTESFMGLLDSTQRRELGLSHLPTLAELVVPRLYLAAFTLGVGAEFLQGGEQMRAHLPMLGQLATALPGAGHRCPAFMPGHATRLLGVDGRPMHDDNAIYLASDLYTLAAQLERVPTLALLRRIMTAVDPNTRIEFGNGATLEGAREQVGAALAELLRPFREAKTDAEQIGVVLERSAAEIGARLRARLIEIKAALRLPGYSQQG